MKTINKYICEVNKKSEIKMVRTEIIWNGFKLMDYFNEGNDRNKYYTKEKLERKLKRLKNMPDFVVTNYDYDIDDEYNTPDACSRLTVVVNKDDEEQAIDVLNAECDKSWSFPKYFYIDHSDDELTTFMFNNSKKQ